MPLSGDEQRQLDDLERQLHIDEDFALLVGGLVRRLRLRLAAISVTALAAGALVALSVSRHAWGMRGPGLALLLVTAGQVWAVGRDEHLRPAHHAWRAASHLLRRLSPVPALRGLRHALAGAVHRVRHLLARIGHRLRHPRSC